MKWLRHLFALLLLGATAQAQIQVELKFKRLQYIAHEPIIASITITNLAGRDVDLHDDSGQHWFGFEVNAGFVYKRYTFVKSVARMTASDIEVMIGAPGCTPGSSSARDTGASRTDRTPTPEASRGSSRPQ